MCPAQKRCMRGTWGAPSVMRAFGSGHDPPVLGSTPLGSLLPSVALPACSLALSQINKSNPKRRIKIKKNKNKNKAKCGGSGQSPSPSRHLRRPFHSWGRRLIPRPSHADSAGTGRFSPRDSGGDPVRRSRPGLRSLLHVQPPRAHGPHAIRTPKPAQDAVAPGDGGPPPRQPPAGDPPPPPPPRGAGSKPRLPAHTGTHRYRGWARPPTVLTDCGLEAELVWPLSPGAPTAARSPFALGVRAPPCGGRVCRAARGRLPRPHAACQAWWSPGGASGASPKESAGRRRRCGRPSPQTAGRTASAASLVAPRCAPARASAEAVGEEALFPFPEQTCRLQIKRLRG